MFIALLIVTFLIATAACAVVARAFSEPVAVILTRIVADELAMAWQRYVIFALYLLGINGGVRIWQLERFVRYGQNDLPLLNADRWALEVYRTLIGSLQSLAVALLAFFVLSLLAYLRVRSLEVQSGRVVTPARAA